MAEYINKKYLDRKFITEMLAPSTTTIFDVKDIIDGLPTADVIERAEYDKLLEENKQLKRIISDKVNEDLKGAFEIKELRSKIDEAIEEIDFLRQHRAKYITEDNKICIDSGEVLKILKEI